MPCIDTVYHICGTQIYHAAKPYIIITIGHPPDFLFAENPYTFNNYTSEQFTDNKYEEWLCQRTAILRI